MEKNDYKSLAAKLFCFGCLLIVGVLFFKYIFVSLVPFLIAWGIAYAVYPIALELSHKTKITRRACSFFLVLLLLIIVSLLLFLAVNRLVLELQNLMDYLINNGEEIAGYFESIFDFFNSLGERLPIINKLQDTELIANIVENINSVISNIWNTLLETLGTALPDIAGTVVSTLPNILLVSLVTIIACFYFALDLDIVNDKIKEFLPNKIVNILSSFKRRFVSGFKKYLKAYLLIFCITFAELFVGFLILGVNYSLVLAFLISIIDFLPVFGTGVILLPWGIVLLLMKNYFLGIGILLLLIIMTVVRQVIEPKIVGKSLGVHPILSLVTLYVGFQLFGIVGMIFLPIVTIIFLSKPDTEKQE